LALAIGLCLTHAAIAQDAGGSSSGSGSDSRTSTSSDASTSQPNPYYIGASQSFTHDSNVFRRSENSTLPVVSDTVSSTGILGGIDQPFGRQRIYANGTAATNRHRNQEQLNNTSYGLAAGLDWSALERLSGNVRLSANQSLANYGDVNAVVTTEKNLQKSRQASASVRYGVATALGIEGGVDHNSIDFTQANDLRTVRQNGANIGVRWGGGGALSILVSGRASQAKYPTLQTSPTTIDSDTVDRRDIDTTVTYVPTGISTFTASVRATRETHSLLGRQNFNGLTGGVTWDYHLSGKVALKAAVSRDTGTATTFLQLPVAIAPGLPISTLETFRVDAARLSTTASLEAGYALTGKIGLSANLRHVTASTSGFAADALTAYGLGASYQPTRTVSLGCSVNRETRKAVYSDNTFGCHGELTFR